MIAFTSLFVVLGAGAYAAAKIDSGDIKNSTIVSKDIKNKKGVKGNDVKDSSLTGADVKDGTVTGGDIADGSVAGVDLTASEPAHFVGAAGEPAFGNGGQGDCLYSNLPIPPGAITPADALGSVSFQKDKTGEVHLDGIVAVEDGAGGDGTCGPESIEDNVMFTLPEAYRPAFLEIHTDVSGETILVNGTRDVTSGGQVIPAGVVLHAPAIGGIQLILSDISWQAASGPSPARTKVNLSESGELPAALKELLP